MSDERDVQVANEIVNVIEEFLRVHEEEEHDGGMCMSERAGFVAFLAHRLGIRDQESVLMLLGYLAEYEEGHVDGDGNGEVHLH